MNTSKLLPVATMGAVLLLNGCFSTLNDRCQATQTECYERCDTFCDPWWGCWEECAPVCQDYCVDYVGSDQCGSNYDCNAGEVCTDYGVCRSGDGGNAGSLCSPCNTDNDCGERDAMCVTFGSDMDAFCGRICGVDNDCPQGYSCVEAGSSRQCVPTVGACGDGPKGQCRNDDECLGELVCVDAECVPPEPTSCTTSAQCATGETCIDARCRSICTATTDCQSDEVCQGSQCIPLPPAECSVSADCGSATALCVDSKCLTRCVDNDDCESGETCNGTYCE